PRLRPSNTPNVTRLWRRVLIGVECRRWVCGGGPRSRTIRRRARQRHKPGLRRQGQRVALESAYLTYDTSLQFSQGAPERVKFELLRINVSENLTTPAYFFRVSTIRNWSGGRVTNWVGRGRPGLA